MSGRSYDAVYLSPHLDDAVLSCGGQIHDRAAAGEAVLVVTVMAGDEPAGCSSPLIRSLHRAWGLDGPAGNGEELGVVARRRAEDVEACEVLGADWLHWDLQEAMYRRAGATGEPFYRSLRELFATIPPADRPAVLRVAERLDELPRGRLHVPLGVGGHVDHRIVREAAEARFGGELVHYQEYPYGRRQRKVRPLVRGSGWNGRRVPVSRDGARAKVRAVAAYKSQFGPMLGGRRRMERRVLRNLRAHGETLWRWEA